MHPNIVCVCVNVVLIWFIRSPDFQFWLFSMVNLSVSLLHWLIIINICNCNLYVRCIYSSCIANICCSSVVLCCALQSINGPPWSPSNAHCR